MFTPDDARNNHRLSTLPRHEFDRIRPALERVSLTAGQVLHESGYELEYVYYPTTALISLLYLTQSGTTVGVGLIGNEGILGIEIFFGGDLAPSMAVVQNAGIAYRMKAGAFRAKCVAAPACRDSLLRYSQALITQVSQTAACIRFHSVQQRFARWLLESLDRLDTNRLALTHEQVAGLLGTRRESITLAAHNLSVPGLIKVERGSVTILDRPGLERAACECYKVVSAEYGRLLGQGIPRTFSETPERRVQARESAML
jgi:CRP-like cAMP-binding protein